MIPMESKPKRLKVHRNRGGVLFGASWLHDARWHGPRRTHFYLGWWVLTLTSGPNRSGPGELER